MVRLRLGLSGIVGLLFVLAWASLVSPAADTLPAQLPDAEYWKMVADYSEPDGYFQYDIVTSNEISYQTVLPDLMRIARPGGTYLGVGPEQNFTYIAALQPKIAFLIDIRRAMMLEHLMYKAIFEMSADRIEFVANLFARKIPPQLTAESSVQTIFKRFANNPADRALADQRLKDILTRLKVRHSFPLTVEDERGIRALYTTFIREGVVNFSASFRSPGYAGLMTLTDYTGRNWSFLVSKENYDRVRAMHQKNLIVPLVGDFAGPKAIRVVGKYLRDHGATVNVFYISNVEDYIQHVWPQYVANIASLPLDSSSRFIRWSTNSQTTLASMDNFVRAQRPARR